MPIETLLANVPVSAVAAISAGLLRNVAGWVENTWRDGKADEYEWQQLAGTIVKYFAGILLLSFGMPLEAAVAATFGLDVVASALKTVKK